MSKKCLLIIVDMFSGNKRSLDLSLYGNTLNDFAMKPAEEVPEDFKIGIFKLENGKTGPLYLPINYFHIFDHE